MGSSLMQSLCPRQSLRALYWVHACFSSSSTTWWNNWIREYGCSQILQLLTLLWTVRGVVLWPFKHDLYRLAVWERTRQIEFHPGKCQVLCVTSKKSASIITHGYILHGQTLSIVSEVKYLGLTLSDHLKWDKHIGKCKCHPKPSKLLHT